MGQSLLFTGPQFLHWPGASGFCYSQVQAMRWSLGRSPLSTVVCLDSPKWPLGAALPGIYDKQGGEAAAGPGSLCKPLIFPHLTIIRAALKSQQWQMQAQGEGLQPSIEDPPKFLSRRRTFLWHNLQLLGPGK